MKKSADIVGLPVISIREGTELGVVKDLVINPSSGSVAALVIDDGKWYLGATLLPFAAVSGIGEYAVTVESGNNLLVASNAPELVQLLILGIKVIGTKVLTKVGRIQGKVTEIIIDASGKIAVCEVEDTSNELIHIPSQRILTFGKEVLIISDSEENLYPPSANIVASVDIPATPVINTPTSTPSEEPKTTSQSQTDESAKKFDEKHRKYLLGKRTNRKIETDNGMIIIEQGGEITEEVIQKAKLAGKFVELSMSIQ